MLFRSAAYITDHMRVHNQSQHHACHLCNRSEGNYFLQINISFNGYYFCRIFYTYPTKLSNPSVLIDILILNPTLLFLLCSLSLLSAFTTLTYLRVHAQKHHGQEWKESGGARGSFGGTGAGGVLLCQLCGVQCKTITQLQGHMGTHTTPQSAPSPSSPVGTTSVAVTVSGSTPVGLLVTDCSSIAPQPHS